MEWPIKGTSHRSEPRLISFQKEGSVGLRLCGGNRSGVFVSGVQPASPAALQGLQPADKILKVNEMEMKGVTREEAVLFLLSLQERIDLIVQHSPDQYNAVVSGQMPGDSFHIKSHFHYTEPTDGEMPFRSGDVFHVVDTLHNGTVGAWQVFRIGRNNQEVQKGIIPNKARAEELATAQFNATKKELSGSEGKHNFFRRRRSTHRRSKSLGKEHWDEVVLSDSISKFPAYERVVLKQPGFVRPVVVLGPIADIAREKLLTENPDKFASPQMDSSLEDSKTKTTGIIRLSSIRSIMERGKHALLDITPNAVDRLNYAQFYPIVIFLKADNKHIIKQLRAGLPKSAHKSSKKLLEQCQHTERVWGHVFTHTVTLNEANQGIWYSKLTDLIQRTQQQQLWVSETKHVEMVSDIYFPIPPSPYPALYPISYPINTYPQATTRQTRPSHSLPVYAKPKAPKTHANQIFDTNRNHVPYYYSETSNLTPNSNFIPPSVHTVSNRKNIFSYPNYDDMRYYENRNRVNSLQARLNASPEASQVFASNAYPRPFSVMENSLKSPVLKSQRPSSVVPATETHFRPASSFFQNAKVDEPINELAELKVKLQEELKPKLSERVERTFRPLCNIPNCKCGHKPVVNPERFSESRTLPPKFDKPFSKSRNLSLPSLKLDNDDTPADTKEGDAEKALTVVNDKKIAEQHLGYV
ncbi:Tight junction protein ZO-1 [Eumeta japonica]|uniref:Tight junction protein ZO-1 n=1 Tax=Eumeta variegata TaxID=151549 RepID=A0A4C1XAW8_EUMVA|nr:Tight junction protein ZO-1 [Eumeta japonica]